MKTATNILILIIAVAGNLLWAQDKTFVANIELDNYDYPFAVKSINIMIQEQQLTMRFMEIEPQNPNGKSVLLLHGKNFASNYWERTATDLAAAGYRVVVPDQIGFGKSSKPTNIQYSFQLLAQNTKYLLDALLIKKVNVIGHSMGGMLATRFALMYPETVEKLVLENPIGLEDWKTVVPYQSVDDWFESELQQDYDKLKKYQIENYYGGNWKPEYEKWLEIPAGWTRNLDYGIIAKNSALTYDMIFTQPVVYEFENLKMPVLLIIGQRDRTALGKAKAPKEIREKLGNYPALGKATAAKIKNSKLVEIENVGHLPHIEAYDKFLTPLLEFLK